MESFFFFGPEHEPLFGALHRPSEKRALSTGVVICPPLGRDNVTTYRPLRMLAKRLAERGGCPTLRFDWPGTGDSCGDANGTRLVEQWLKALPLAIHELQERTGAERVALVGVGIGATLAALSAPEEPLVTDLVLWAPHVSGSAYLRELRALEAFSLPDDGTPTRDGVLPAGSLESTGFYFSPETVEALSALDLLAIDVSGSELRRVLLIGSDGREPEQRLVERFRPVLVDVAAGRDLDTLLNDPTRITRRMFDDILRWVAHGSGSTPANEGTSVQIARNHTGTSFREEVVVLRPDSRPLLGVVTKPALDMDSDAPWVVFFTTGSVRRCGPHRMWTRLAREWAAAGVPSLRIDAWGVGDSDGPDAATPNLSSLYAPEVQAGYDSALDWLRETYSPTSVAAVGMCSGSTMAFQAAQRHSDITRCLLVNLPRFEWRSADETDVVLSTFREPDFLVTRWRRLRAGKLELKRSVARTADAAQALVHVTMQRRADANTDVIGSAAAAGVEKICRRGGGLLLVYASEDPALAYLEQHYPSGAAELSQKSNVRIEAVPGAGHTFMPIWAQNRLTALFGDALRDAHALGDEARARQRKRSPAPSFGRMSPSRALDA